MNVLDLLRTDLSERKEDEWISKNSTLNCVRRPKRAQAPRNCWHWPNRKATSFPKTSSRLFRAMLGRLARAKRTTILIAEA
jgi:hypothetical protein